VSTTRVLWGAGLGLAIIATMLMGTIVGNKLADNRVIPLATRDPFMPGARRVSAIEYYSPSTYNARGKRLLAWQVFLQCLFIVETIIALQLLGP